jgi:LPXTG-motif cell wall-anchored protein
MGLFGGSSQSTSSVVSTINFDPTIQFGENQEATSEKTLDQTATTSPRLDDSLGLSASVGVGVGGTGSGGTATTSRLQDESTAPTLAKADGVITNNQYLIYGGIALAVGGGVYFFMKKKKKR